MSILSAFTSGIMAATGGGASAAEIAGLSERQFDNGGWYSRSASGMRVSPHAAKRLPVFFACVAKRATSIAMLPCKMMSDDGKGGHKPATNHPLYDVLYSRPNHIQSAFEFWFMMEAHLCMRGNSYAEIIPGARGAVDELMPMHPDRVRVERLLGSGRMRYRYTDPLTNTVRILMQDEVFHRRENPDEVGIGQSRIEVGCEAIGLGLQRQDYMARFTRNDATPGAVFTGADFKTIEDEDDFVESVRKARTGANAGRPYLLPPGMNMKSLGFTPVQAQLVEAGKLSDQQICSLMGVLPHTVGIDAGKAATFASTEQFNLMDVQQRVLPQVIAAEQDISRSLVTNTARFFPKFSVASLMRGDAATRGEFYQALAGIGWMCADEGRELEDMGPIPDGSGKRFWNPLNWGLTDRKPATTPPTSTGVGVPEDEDEDDATDPTQGGSDNEEDAEEADKEQARAAGLGLIKALVTHNRTDPRTEAA